MRPIKFRGKAVDTGEWVYGSYVLNPIDSKSFILSVHETTLEPTEIIPETLGQYTGSKASNGVDIYEGDILDFRYYQASLYLSRDRGFVDFVDANFALKRKGDDRFNVWLCTSQLVDTKIVGNTTDNLEILELNYED